jgi:hypothetical protein
MYDATDPRTPRAPHDRARTLGPYEAAYDTRRGYDAVERPARHVRHDADEVWRGRGREER